VLLNSQRILFLTATELHSGKAVIFKGIVSRKQGNLHMIATHWNAVRFIATKITATADSVVKKG
jgi:hypothetical protein